MIQTYPPYQIEEDTDDSDSGSDSDSDSYCSTMDNEDGFREILEDSDDEDLCDILLEPPEQFADEFSLQTNNMNFLCACRQYHAIQTTCIRDCDGGKCTCKSYNTTSLQICCCSPKSNYVNRSCSTPPMKSLTTEHTKDRENDDARKERKQVTNESSIQSEAIPQNVNLSQSMSSAQHHGGCNRLVSVVEPLIIKEVAKQVFATPFTCRASTPEEELFGDFDTYEYVFVERCKNRGQEKAYRRSKDEVWNICRMWQSNLLHAGRHHASEDSVGTVSSHWKRLKASRLLRLTSFEI